MYIPKHYTFAMYNGVLLLTLLLLLVVTSVTSDERRKFVRVITEPKPGEEYVSIHTGKPSSGFQKPLGIQLLTLDITQYK